MILLLSQKESKCIYSTKKEVWFVAIKMLAREKNVVVVVVLAMVVSP
jgi:hypothetical protein